MKKMFFKKIFSGFKSDHKRMNVYALIGRAGSGKSFRARLIAEKYDIDYIIDDGLLIRGNQIIAGISAKREKTRFMAVKRAIFFKDEHADDIQKQIQFEKPKSILVLGISKRMIDLISKRLDLPELKKIIYIDDIATPEEITRAKRIRKEEGKHVRPVPILEVRKDPAHHIIDTIKLFLFEHGKRVKKKRIFEKTIVQTPYTRGSLSISNGALTQMIIHCFNEFEKLLVIKKVTVFKALNGYKIDVRIIHPYQSNIPDRLKKLQNYVIKNIEGFTGIYIKELNLIIDEMKEE